MNCREIESLIPVYLEDECSLEERSLVESHLGGCPACREAVEEYRLLDHALLSRLEAVPPAAETIRAVMSRIRPRRSGILIGRFLGVPSLAIVLFMAATGMLYLFRTRIAGLFARDIELDEILARAIGDVVNALVQVSGGDVWVLSIMYGGLTLVILLAMGLSVQHVLRGGRL